jgi:hypothetical protein
VAAIRATAPDLAEARTTRGAVDWLLVIGCCLLGGYAAVLAFFFLPLYAGSVPVPVSALLLAGLIWLLPATCFRLTGSLLAAAAPAISVFVVLLVLLAWPRSLNAGAPLQVYLAQWRLFLLLGAVALAGAARLGLLWGDVVAARVRAEQTAAGTTNGMTNGMTNRDTVDGSSPPGGPDAPKIGPAGDTEGAENA